MITKTFSRFVFAFQTLIVVAGMIAMPSVASASILDDLELDINLPTIDFATEGAFDFENIEEGENTVVFTSSSFTKCELEVNTNEVEYGGSATLTWEVDGFDTVAINGETVSGETGTLKIEDIVKDSFFELTATNNNGDSCFAEVKVECLDPVEEEVVEEEDPVEHFTRCNLEASATTVEIGGSVEFSWNLDGYDDVVFNEEVVFENDSRVIEHNYPKETYHLRATNRYGDVCEKSIQITGETKEEVVEEKEEEPVYYPVAPTCEFEPKAGRTIVDFTGQKLRTDKGAAQSQTDAQSIELPVGEYDVWLMSWDGYQNRVNTSQPNEQWKLHFLNGETIVAASGYSTDLADNVIEDTKIDDVNKALEIPGSVTAIRGVQPYFPNLQFANSLYPICAAIDNVTPEVETPAPTCEFYPTVATIDEGKTTELNWTTTNAVRVVLSGGTGEVALNGSASITPLATYMYNLTAFGEDGQEVSCETKITVETEEESVVISGCTDSTATNYDADATESDDSCEYPEVEVLGCTDEDANNYDADANKDDNSCTYTTTSSGGGGSSSPRCELEVSDATIDAGDTVTLTWETARARDITLTDDQGNVLVTTDDRLSDDKSELLDSSFKVSPTKDTVYTLVAERGSRDRDCSVEVEVAEEELIILEARDQAPLVAGISLSEVPYTGFEAGPIMTTLFYTLLVAWALYLTYVLVIPKAALQTVAASTNTNFTPTATQQMKEAEAMRPDVFANVAPATPVVASTAAPAVAAPANLPVAPVAPEVTVAPTVPATMTDNTPVEVAALEAIAHNHQALLSNDAIKTFIISVPAAEQLTKIVELVNNAKAQFPLEDGWVVVNNDRMLALLTA